MEGQKVKKSNRVNYAQRRKREECNTAITVYPNFYPINMTFTSFNSLLLIDCIFLTKEITIETVSKRLEISVSLSLLCFLGYRYALDHCLYFRSTLINRSFTLYFINPIMLSLLFRISI